MSKIAIATPVDMNNLGNRLQNFAVCEICKKIGLEPVTIDFPKMYCGISINTIIRLMSPICNIPGLCKIDVINKVKKLVKGYLFTQKYLPCIECVSEKQIKEVIDSCDYYGIGGDQIWSAFWAKKIWFCGFANKNPDKKICFAPSFGKACFSDSEKQILYPQINEISFPAVREITGQTLFKEITGRECIHIIDPVLMLNMGEWLKISGNIRIPSQKYVLSYFLGKNLEQQAVVNRIAQEIGLKIINVLDPSDKMYYGIGPDDLIALISKAQYVFTDSYHGILMSLILESPFVICQRMDNGQASDMNTRIECIVRIFDLSSRLFNNINDRNIDMAKDEFLRRKLLIKSYSDEAWKYYKKFVSN